MTAYILNIALFNLYFRFRHCKSYSDLFVLVVLVRNIVLGNYFCSTSQSFLSPDFAG
jgi:hypothetical protein